MPHIISQTQVDLDDELQLSVNTRPVLQERFNLASNQLSLVIVKSHVQSMPRFGKKKKKVLHKFPKQNNGRCFFQRDI